MRKLGAFFVVSFVLVVSGCASQPKIESAAASPEYSVQFNMQSGEVTMVASGQPKPLGTIKRSGKFQVPDGANVSDYMLAVAIMIRAQFGEQWADVVKGLPE